MHTRTVSALIVALLCAAVWSPRTGAELRTDTEAIVKDGQTLDPDGLLLENDYIKAVIADNEHAGKIMHLHYKPTGQDLAPARNPQGYAGDRMGEDRYFWRNKSSDYAGRIVGIENGEAVAENSYTWHYDYNDIQTDIRVHKRYALPENAATLYVTWTLENVGDQAAQMSPWVKHVGGQNDSMFTGPRRMLDTQGIADPGGEFVDPVTNWIARLSGEQDTSERPMMVSLMDYSDIFQQFMWQGTHRYTLETVLNRITLEPGETWQTTYAIAPMANLGNLAYASPELGAAVRVNEGELSPEKPATLTLSLAPATDLGEKRLEGEILNADGDLVQTLPHRQMTLTPGTIETTDYEFTPPSEGVYTLSIAVFDESQQIVRLGERVNSQQGRITLPVVVGPTPAQVVARWESEGVTFPGRETRDLTPWRTVLNSPALKAGQVRVPERVFPEDRFTFSAETQPATVRLAKGEYEGIQLAVQRADDGDVMALDLSLAPLTHDDGTRIEDLELREVFYLTTNVPSGYRDFPIGQWPDPLFRLGWQDKLDADAEAVQTNLKLKRQTGRRVFWVLARAPRDASAGVYRGTLEISDGDQTLGT
ncbi:MAG: hypothetical protein ACOC9P_02720, partial [bacterium]